MSRVYYITVDELEFEQTSPPTWVSNDIFYVLGEDEDEAKQHLREQIKKYYFKAKLSGKDSDDPKRLGHRIICEGYVTEVTAIAPLDAFDFTATAYLYKEDKKELWSDWDVTMEDACA